MRKIWLLAVAVSVICLPVFAADFNGDGINDIGVFRPSDGLWSVKGVTRTYFGQSGDQPMPGDYNGNGRADIAIFRPSSGLWLVKGVTRSYFGNSSDQPLIGVLGAGGGGGGLWSQNGSHIYYDDGHVGIGKSDPFTYELEVNGAVYCAGSAYNGIEVENPSWSCFYAHNSNYDGYVAETCSRNFFRGGSGHASFCVQSNGNVGIGTTTPNYRLHIYNDEGVSRYRFSNGGTAYATGGWLTGSPKIGIDNPSVDDYLDWALEDAKKPNYGKDGIPSEAEMDKYAKDPTKIAIGTARYVEYLREHIEELEARIARLEKLEQSLASLKE